MTLINRVLLTSFFWFLFPGLVVRRTKRPDDRDPPPRPKPDRPKPRRNDDSAQHTNEHVDRDAGVAQDSA